MKETQEKTTIKCTGPGILVTRAFAVALALMIMVGLSSYHSTALLVPSVDARRRSNVALKKFRCLLSAPKDADTGHRRYLIAGEEYYWEPSVADVAGTGERNRPI